MKKIVFLSIALLFVGRGSWVSAEFDRGSRYNPYNPYQYESGGGQGPVIEKGYPSSPESLANPEVTEPRRWYDSQKNYEKTYEKNVESPKTLTNPYKDIKPYPSEALTSPYEGVIPQRPEKPTTTQQLTPPAVKSE